MPLSLSPAPQELGRIAGGSKAARAVGEAGLGGEPWPIVRPSGAGSSGGTTLKFNIEVECTPDEARRVLGLPEVAPMQQRLIEQMEARLKETVREMDGKAMLEQWLPIGIKGVEQFQTMWTQLAAAAAGVQRNRKPRGEGGSDDPK